MCKPTSLSLLALLVVCALPEAALAFCGFYVASGEAKPGCAMLNFGGQLHEHRSIRSRIDAQTVDCLCLLIRMAI